MPELPEVEVVRRGLARWVTGARIGAVEVLHPRPVRWHTAGPVDFASRLTGTVVRDVVRRGKFLWLELDSGEGLLAHLGMSGQLVLQPPDAGAERHLRVRLALEAAPATIGSSASSTSGCSGASRSCPSSRRRTAARVGAAARGRAPRDWTPSAPWLPPSVAHIARDPLDPNLDEKALVTRWRAKRTGVKRALLDQTLLSGVGNIYADEALWRARLHYARPTDAMTRPAVGRVLAAVREVMSDALVQGGTSFDALYVNVNGESGYFDRSLAVYGREGLPCPRCGTLIRRDRFMNRSSFYCPHDQPRPRSGRW